MSQENVEAVRRAIEAYGREGLDGVLRYPTLRSSGPVPGTTSSEPPIASRGLAPLPRLDGREFKDLRIEPVDLIEAGEQVISGPAEYDKRTQPAKENAMDIVEIEQKETVSRKEVATRLRKLATMLAKGNEIKFDQGGMTMSVHVPDEVQLKVEVEASTDERELEIELKW